ncbi:MAG: hypothetical protein ABMA15_26935, partial [Vicinamibacterales bacterium]
MPAPPAPPAPPGGNRPAIARRANPTYSQRAHCAIEDSMSDTIKYLLDESRIPTCWYNLMADLPSPP